MKQKLVSIAMATYNGEKYLKEQLDSILSQTYKNIEIVVSDDMSGDGTVEILKEYSWKCGLKYSVNKENTGFIKNFEKAVSLCRGDYIALADQDDIWEPDKIELLVKEIADYSIVCSDASVIDSEGNELLPSLNRSSGHYMDTDDQFKFFVFRNYVTGHTALIKREVLDIAIPIPDGVMYHDWWFANVASVLNGVRYLDLPLTRYRQHQYNHTGASKKSGLLQKFKEFKNNSKDSFGREIRSLNAMLGTAIFTAEQKSVIKDRIAFYNDLNSTFIHFKSFLVVVKYRKYILAGKSIQFKIAFILASLVM